MSTNNASLAMQRIAKLVDENSFMEIGSLITARNTDFNLSEKKSASDGVITGYGLVDSNLTNQERREDQACDQGHHGQREETQ